MKRRKRSNFWCDLPKPFFCLAPMADVTDAAFRRLIAREGKPDIMWTEFVSADGLLSAGKNVLIKDLAFDEGERPIVAQLFTSKPENMAAAAKLAAKLGFDGVDINMGCPDKAIEKQKCGAALIKHPKLAQELIAAAKTSGLPISVKTRIGYHKNELEEWLPALLGAEPECVTIHWRTRKEMSKVPAHWELAPRAVAIRDEMKSQTLIAGNGDALNLKNAKALAKQSGVDGVMLGRAIFGNPWLFAKRKNLISAREKLEMLMEHCWLYEQLVIHKRFPVMKKHFKAYVTGWDGAKELRMQLMETKNAAEAEKVIQKYLKISSTNN